jgi:hypothetical protein
MSGSKKQLMASDLCFISSFAMSFERGSVSGKAALDFLSVD